MPTLSAIRKTFGRDVKAIFCFYHVRAFVKKCYLQNATAADLFRKLVKKHPDKICFIGEEREWTFQEVEDFSNQIANYFAAQGYEKGNEIALFMGNRPEYICIWLGLSKIGVVPALINTNLRLNALAHTINVIECKAIIYGVDLSSAVQDLIPLVENKEVMNYYNLGAETVPVDFPSKSLDVALKDVSTDPPNADKYKINFNDKLVYIYTSGTTGLPKAAMIRHKRFVWIAASAKIFMKVSDSDVFYNALPLYHTNGGFLFVATVLTFGGTMVIRKKFSASNFWSDAIKYNATVSQYIGETCRFLLAQPKKPEDKQHKIRLMSGNGLRSQIWSEFVERFNIEKMLEIYGATEGNANVANFTGKVGAVGYLPLVFASLYPVTLIRVDPETGTPLRNEEGMCIRCKPGEPGEMVGKIIKDNPFSSFDGYVNKKATQKKIIQDCFHKGDMAFRSGDLLTMDEEGYLYFVDRTGDTYRWRGENVSTNEVEMIISKEMDLAICVSYGVEVPGSEGRAGMVAIQKASEEFDLEKFHDRVRRCLAPFAVPIFIRLCSNIQTTGTYKLQKVGLQKEGYDIEKVKDPMYFLNPQTRNYVKLDKEIYQQIIDGKVRL